MGKQYKVRKFQYTSEMLDKIAFVGGGECPLKGVSGAEACAVMGYHGQLQHIMKVQLAEAKRDLTIKNKLQKKFPSPELFECIEEDKKKIQYAREIIGECDRAALYEMFSRHHETEEEIWRRVNETIKVHYQDRENGTSTPKVDTNKYPSLHTKSDDRTK